VFQQTGFTVNSNTFQVGEVVSVTATPSVCILATPISICPPQPNTAKRGQGGVVIPGTTTYPSGVFVGGNHWWNIDFGAGIKGWVSETSIAKYVPPSSALLPSPPPVNFIGDQVVFPSPEVAFIIGPQVKASSPSSLWPWYDSTQKQGLIHGASFPETPQQEPSGDHDVYLNRQYYDLGLTLYTAYYRTGDVRFLYDARKVVDSWWLDSIFQNCTPTSNNLCASPRSVSLGGLMLRALDGRPEMWPWIEKYVNEQNKIWIERYLNPASPGYNYLAYGVRDGGYMLTYAAWLAKVHPDPNIRASWEKRALNGAKNYFVRLQDADGCFYWAIDTDDNPATSDVQASQPFQVGLLMEGMIATHQLTNDSTIAQSIVKAADCLYTKSYEGQPVSNYPQYNWRAMRYYTLKSNYQSNNRTNSYSYQTTISSTGGIGEARQYNPNTVHVFGYAYQLTNDTKYLLWGDEVFAAAFGKGQGPGADAYTSLADFREKEYNEAYRSSGKYLVWRAGTNLPPIIFPPGVSINFSASPNQILSGQPSTLTWNSVNATTCVASGGWSGSKTTSGNQQVFPTASTTYSLACTGTGFVSASQSLTISFIPPSNNGEVLVNPGFESDGLNWHRSSFGGRSVVMTESYSGIKSQQMVASSQGVRDVYQVASATSGEVYTASAWVKTSGLSGTGAGAEIIWLNKVVSVETPSPLDIIRTDSLGTVNGNSGWTQLMGNYTSPSNAVQVRFNLRQEIELDGIGTSWFDDLSLVKFGTNVTLPPPNDTTAPVITITTPTPNQRLAAGTVNTRLSVDTNEAATCKYSTSNQLYDDMPNLFSANFGMNHATTLTGLSNGQSYTYYVRCQDSSGNKNNASVAITFSVNSSILICDLTSASWSKTTAFEGDIVYLNVFGNNCNGKTISFDIKENDVVANDPVRTNPLNVVFSGASVSGTWTAEWQDDGLFGGNPEYYFTATVVGTTESIQSGTGNLQLLSVAKLVTNVCGDGVIGDTEQCDNGNQNGLLCNPNYGSSCNYCSAQCQTVTIQGSRCGDGICNGVETSNTCSADCPILPPPNGTSLTATIMAPSANQKLPVGTTQTTLSVLTNQAAMCKYSVNDESYDTMLYTLDGSGTNNHAVLLTNLQNGTNYTRYVRCRDSIGNVMTSSQSVSFSVAIVVPVCGDGTCNGLETSVSCSNDCKLSICGDNICNATETSNSCSNDCPLFCDLTSASWNKKDTLVGETVYLNVVGNNCNLKTISFEIWEYDVIGNDPVKTTPLNVIFSENSAKGSWTAEFQEEGIGESSPPEYYFTASVVGTNERVGSGTGSQELLSVLKKIGRLHKPPKPSSFTASEGSIKLSWSSIDYEYCERIEIYRSTQGTINAPNSQSKIADFSCAQIAYTDEDVVAGTLYYYTLFTIDDLGVYSEPATLSFTAPLEESPNPTTDSGSSGSSSGGGGGGSSSGSKTVKSASVTQTNNLPTTNAETPNIVKDFNPETGIKQIELHVKDNTQDVDITVSQYEGILQAVSVEKSGAVYKYLQIETENLGSRLENAKITFEVVKFWVDGNGIKKEDISLFKFFPEENRWIELQTTYVGEDSEFYYYETELNSFSYFVIGEKESTSQALDSGTSSAEGNNLSKVFVFVLVAIIVVLLLLIIVIRSRRNSRFRN